MKRFLVCIVAAFALISCQTKGAVIEGDVTQDKVNNALEQIYDNYRGQLDMTGAQEYTVVKGDSLSQITRNYYGSLSNVGNAGPSNGFYFPVIMLASDNSGIVDPDLIEPGLVLKIIDLQKNLSNPSARKAIKDCLIDVAYVYNKKGATATEQGLINLANSL
ncbi:MAG: LysM peptidoglycan-binding domain-containing protein [Treponema sp.]|nr:LysM peptidoglycan-binding domain-containing protein [Treponema sp.]